MHTSLCKAATFWGDLAPMQLQQSNCMPTLTCQCRRACGPRSGSHTALPQIFRAALAVLQERKHICSCSLLLCCPTAQPVCISDIVRCNILWMTPPICKLSRQTIVLPNKAHILLRQIMSPIYAIPFVLHGLNVCSIVEMTNGLH
jgi:hypothetical protein